MSEFPSQTQDKFVLRLPDGMRDRIKHVAENNNRSMNAEIVATLKEKYPERRIDVSMLVDLLSAMRCIPPEKFPEEAKTINSILEEDNMVVVRQNGEVLIRLKD
jgi:hypothetical protein